MADNVVYSASYLAQSKAALLNTFYSIPIGLELISTALRIWAKVRRHAEARLGFDDYLMIFATVCFAGALWIPASLLMSAVQ
jgi:hypothetical protein